MLSFHRVRRVEGQLCINQIRLIHILTYASPLQFKTFFDTPAFSGF